MVRLSDTKGDQWNDIADAYKKITTETSNRPIGVMLERANMLLPFAEASGVLDNGCGPGPVMTRLLEEYQIPDAASLTCSDFSEGMIKQVEGIREGAVQSDSQSPWSRVETIVQDAMDLKSIGDASKSHVMAGWVYFMTPDPQKCLSESKRVLKDGGVLACSSWQGSQWLDLMRLLPRVRPDKRLPDLPKEWEDIDLMKRELEKAGFRDVEGYPVETKMTFDKLEPLVDFLITKMPHMVMLTKDFSEGERASLKDLLLEEGRKMCPNEPGSFVGTALVAVGRK